MISALDGVVGGWSKNGDTMVIFDSEKFAAEIIPQYFKHHNFRSFVRQLNFYGFRKLRADANAGPAAQARWAQAWRAPLARDFKSEFSINQQHVHLHHRHSRQSHNNTGHKQS